MCYACMMFSGSWWAVPPPKCGMLGLQRYENLQGAGYCSHLVLSYR